MFSSLIPTRLRENLNTAYRSIDSLTDQQSLIDLLNHFSGIPQNIASQAGSPSHDRTRRISIENKEFFTLLAFHALDEIRNASGSTRGRYYQKFHRILALNPFGEIQSPTTQNGTTKSLLGYAVNISDPEAVEILTIYQENIFHPSVKKELINLLSNRTDLSISNVAKISEIFNTFLNSGLDLNYSDLS
jgi:hypothetical protein